MFEDDLLDGFELDELDGSESGGLKGEAESALTGKDVEEGWLAWLVMIHLALSKIRSSPSACKLLSSAFARPSSVFFAACNSA